jgi:hypothetical protein
MELLGSKITEEIYEEQWDQFIFLLNANFGKNISKKNKKTQDEVQQENPLIAFYKRSFKYPTQKNILEFFKLPMVQLLWREVYSKSPEYRDTIAKASLENKRKLKNFFKKI